MNKSIYVSCIFLALSIFSCKISVEKPTSQESTYSFVQDSAAILQVLDDQMQAWNNADIDGFMQGYWKDERLTFTGARGITYGWQQTKDNYIEGYPDKDAMGKLNFVLKEVSSLGPYSARILGQYKLERMNDSPSGWFTLIFQKIDNQWVITSDMTVATPTPQ